MEIKHLRILLCLVISCLSLLMGIIAGFTQRTPTFNPIYTLKTINASRIITFGTDLVDVDTTIGSMTLDWTIENDSACDPSKTPPCPGLSLNSSVDIFFDTNVLRRNTSTDTIVPSDNQPNTPIFRHNATAVYMLDVHNAMPAFRTPLALFSTQKGRASFSTLQWYPFDEYAVQISVFALDSETRELIGLRIGRADGVVIGYKAFATPSPTPLRDVPEVISELVTISRSALVKAYALIVVTLVWLMTIAFMFIVASIMCGTKLDPPLLLIPVSTLIAVPQLRGSMPGSPVRFGAIIDFIGLLPCLALTTVTAIFAIVFLIFTTPQAKTASQP